MSSSIDSFASPYVADASDYHPFYPDKFKKVLPPKYGIVRVRQIGSEAWIGWPAPCKYCNNNTRQLELLEPPYELRGLYTQEEWNHFRENIERIMRKSSLPWIPCCCIFNLLIGLPLICCTEYRTSLFHEFLERENMRRRKHGLVWSVSTQNQNMECGTAGKEQGSDYRATFLLSWIPGVREAWEAEHPDARRVSQEPNPAMQLLDEEDRAARRAGLSVLGPAPPREQMEGVPSSPPDYDAVQPVNGIVVVRAKPVPTESTQAWSSTEKPSAGAVTVASTEGEVDLQSTG